jgi:RecA-family ATPase
MKTADELRAELDGGPNLKVFKPRPKANGIGRGENPKLPPWSAADPDVLDLARYELEEPTPPPFMIEDLVPKHAVTGLFGQDGTGKSLLGHHLLTCYSLGLDFFGHRIVAPGPKPSLGIYCEETIGILAWRQAAVNRAHGLLFREVGAAGLELRGRLGQDNTLVRMDRGVAEPTKAYDALVRYCVDTERRLLWLDHVLHLLSGDILSATDVAKLLAVLARLAVEIDGAVVLAGHVARSEGSQYLGSAMFSALVRSRLWLRRLTKDDGPPAGADPKALRVLELAKSNHAGLRELTLEWRDGAFFWLGAAEHKAAQSERDKAAESAFIRALRALDEREKAVADRGMTSAAPQMVAWALAPGFGEDELREAMKRLIASGRITPGVVKPWKRADRKEARGLALAEDTP